MRPQDRSHARRLPRYERDTRRWRGPESLVMVIAVIGIVLTGAAAWAALRLDQVTEQRLLQQQTKQAGAVLSTAVLVIEQPLVSAVAVQSTSPLGQTAAAEQLLSKSVGVGHPFGDASIWQRQGGGFRRLVGVGVSPAMPVTSSATQAYLAAALREKTFRVTAFSVGDQRRIAYALGDPTTGYVVYAEQPLPSDHRARVASDSAFAELHYAIYLGRATTAATLTTTDVDPATLPLKGTTARVVVPFGDTALTLVTSRRAHLGAALSQWLPLLLLIGGLLLTAAAAVVARLLDERRRTAEDHAAIAIGMSERLQRALLPLKIPEIPHLEIAVQYVAGDIAAAIGGDWYSFINLDPDRYGFVVGDVSGHGLDAVAVMARARFTLRAYLLRGESPDAVLSASSGQFDITEDDHLATALVGIGNWRTGEVTVANAGHCRPVIVGPEGPRFVNTTAGPPLGTGAFAYEATTFTLGPGETVLCYTDGLIERRGEDIDTGMRRLADVVAGTVDQPIEQFVQSTVRSMRSAQAEDDIAVLAFRWVGP